MTDRLFGSLGVALEPTAEKSIPQPFNPAQVFVTGVVQVNAVFSGQPAQGVTGGMAGTRTVETSRITHRGCTVALGQWDRTLVGDSCVTHYDQLGVDFCLRAVDS